MSNVQTMYALEAAAAYQGEGAAQAVAFLKKYAPWFEMQGDGLTRHVSSALTATATQITDSAANLYAVFIFSPSGAAADVYIQLFNADDTDVTLGTTAPDLVYKCPAAETAVYLCVPGDDNNDLFSAGLSMAATTTHDGNTSVAAASRPTVWVLYA